MSLEYSPGLDTAYIRLRHSPVKRTKEIAPGVLMDLAADGRPVGFELLDANKLLDVNRTRMMIELKDARQRTWLVQITSITSMTRQDPDSTVIVLDGGQQVLIPMSYESVKDKLLATLGIQSELTL